MRNEGGLYAGLTLVTKSLLALSQSSTSFGQRAEAADSKGTISDERQTRTSCADSGGVSGQGRAAGATWTERTEGLLGRSVQVGVRIHEGVQGLDLEWARLAWLAAWCSRLESILELRVSQVALAEVALLARRIAQEAPHLEARGVAKE